MFALIINDGWEYIMYDSIRTVSQQAIAFYIISDLIGTYIIYRVLQAIIIVKFIQANESAH